MTYPMSDRTARSRRNRLPLAGKREASYDALAPLGGFPPARPLVQTGEQDGLPRRTVAVVRHDFIPDRNVRRRKMASGSEAC